MTAVFQPATWPDDTAERITALRASGATWEYIGSDFGVSLQAVRHKAKRLGLLSPRTMRRFTPEEDAIVRADWLANVNLKETADKLLRSWGTVRQRFFHHHKDLHHSRTSRGQKYFQRFGLALLQHGPNAEIAAVAMREKLLTARAEARVAAINAKQKRRTEILDLMEQAIAAGKPRDEAIFEARAFGVNLEEIAGRFDLTRERIRQICDRVAFERVMASPKLEAAE